MLTTLNLPGRPLHTFGRWDENAEKLHTFGRWDGHNVGRNAATAGSRGGVRFCTPPEGEAKMRKNCTPSEGGTDMVEGETQLQQALVEALHLRTFGR